MLLYIAAKRPCLCLACSSSRLACKVPRSVVVPIELQRFRTGTSSEFPQSEGMQCRCATPVTLLQSYKDLHQSHQQQLCGPATGCQQAFEHQTAAYSCCTAECCSTALETGVSASKQSHIKFNSYSRQSAHTSATNTQYVRITAAPSRYKCRCRAHCKMEKLSVHPAPPMLEAVLPNSSRCPCSQHLLRQHTCPSESRSEGTQV